MLCYNQFDVANKESIFENACEMEFEEQQQKKVNFCSK